jgi:hypothetical protein
VAFLPSVLKHCGEYDATAAMQQDSLNVIASAAKQSILRHKEGWIASLRSQ